MTIRGLGAGISAVALTLAGAGIGLDSGAIASSAEPPAKAHTETFTSTTLKYLKLDKNGNYTDFSKDVEHGKVIGADSTSGKYDPSTGVVTGDVSITRKGGLMSGTFSLDTETEKFTGAIRGGLGRYKGVTGTITGHDVSDNVTDVTITYSK